jgi:hypothetical protein
MVSCAIKQKNEMLEPDPIPIVIVLYALSTVLQKTAFTKMHGFLFGAA